MTEENIIFKILVDRTGEKEFDKTIKKVNTLKKVTEQGNVQITKSYHNAAGEIVKRTVKVNRVLKKQETAFQRMKKSMGEFRMEFLGMMFGFMQAARIMQSVMTETVGTFMKITEGASEASQGLLHLSAEFEYLKYSVGNAIADALAPFIPTLVEIITKVRDFVNEHPKLTGAFFVIGTVAALAGFALFSFLLFANAATIFMQGPMFEALTKASTKFSGLATTILGIGFIVLAVIGIIMTWASETLTAGDKIALTIGYVSLALLGLAVMIGSLPLVIIATFGLIIAAMILFKDQIGDLMLALFLKWVIFNLDFRIKFFETLELLETKAREWANSLIDMINAVTGGFAGLSHISTDATITGKMTDALRLQRASAEVGLDHMTYTSPSFKERFAELKSGMMSDYSMDTALPSEAAAGLTSSTTNSTSTSSITNIDSVAINVTTPGGQDAQEFTNDILSQLSQFS